MGKSRKTRMYGTNPRSTGTSARQLGLSTQKLGITPAQLGITAERLRADRASVNRISAVLVEAVAGALLALRMEGLIPA